MKPSDFKFSTKFTSPAKVSLGSIVKANQERLLATASLDELKAFLPDDEVIEENSDLLYTSFNAAVINLINANDHGMATETILAVDKYFKDRYMNVEHNRYQVIGHIMNYGYSSFGDNKILEASSLKGSTEPFNLCLAAIVYKVVDEWLAEMIEDSADPKSYMYKEISASWEVGYNEYDIVLGSKKLQDAEIITEESKQIDFDEHLKLNGGTGFAADGTPVYALIKGSDVRPLGCAFTFSPAAPVKGVTTASKPKADGPIVIKTLDEVSEPLTASLNQEDKEELANLVTDRVKTAISEKNKEKRSLNKKRTVIENMKIKAIEDITSDYLQEAQASEVTSFIREQLQSVSDDFAAKLNTAETEKADVASQLQTVQDDKKKVEDQVTALSTEVNDLKETMAAKDKEDAFNSRMSELSEAFELTDDQRSAVASQIRDLTTEEFDGWKKQFGLFASTKSEKIETPDPAKVAAEALDSVKPEDALIPNGQSGEEDTMDSVMNSFRDNLKIQAR